MNKHLRYASYVVRHKWFVFRAGLKTGAPIGRLLIHDLSKLRPSEWAPYTERFYGDNAGHLDKDGESDAFQLAWTRHWHRNPHHWEHWLIFQDDGSMRGWQMPDGLVREMVADWMGAGRAITGRWEAGAWYDTNGHRMTLHADTRVLVNELIDQHAR